MSAGVVDPVPPSAVAVYQTFWSVWEDSHRTAYELTRNASVLAVAVYSAAFLTPDISELARRFIFQMGLPAILIAANFAFLGEHIRRADAEWGLHSLRTKYPSLEIPGKMDAGGLVKPYQRSRNNFAAASGAVLFGGLVTGTIGLGMQQSVAKAGLPIADVDWWTYAYGRGGGTMRLVIFLGTVGILLLWTVGAILGVKSVYAASMARRHLEQLPPTPMAGPSGTT